MEGDCQKHYVTTDDQSVIRAMVLKDKFVYSNSLVESAIPTSQDRNIYFAKWRDARKGKSPSKLIASEIYANRNINTNLKNTEHSKNIDHTQDVPKGTPQSFADNASMI